MKQVVIDWDNYLVYVWEEERIAELPLYIETVYEMEVKDV